MLFGPLYACLMRIPFIHDFGQTYPLLSSGFGRVYQHTEQFELDTLVTQLSVLLSFRFLAGADRRCQRAQGARDTCGVRQLQYLSIIVRQLQYLSIIVRQLQYLSIIVHKLSGGPDKH